MVNQRNTPLKRYAIMFVIIVVAVGGLCAYGFFQEDIELFIKLREWDHGAPGRAVTSFLNAAKRGDAVEADRYVDLTTYKPLKKDDKPIGYFLASPAGILDIPFSELAPDGEVQIASVKFVRLSEGAAEVQVSRKGSDNAKFRLKMREGAWKIVDILSSGHVRQR